MYKISDVEFDFSQNYFELCVKQDNKSDPIFMKINVSGPHVNICDFERNNNFFVQKRDDLIKFYELRVNLFKENVNRDKLPNRSDMRRTSNFFDMLKDLKNCWNEIDVQIERIIFEFN